MNKQPPQRSRSNSNYGSQQATPMQSASRVSRLKASRVKSQSVSKKEVIKVPTDHAPDEDGDSFVSMRSNRYLNDSELESQMDDFMITDQSKSSQSNQSVDFKEQSSCCSDQMTHSNSNKLENIERIDPEARILNSMMKFYNDNYVNFKVCSKRSVLKEEVWNIYYDQNQDTIFVFIAKLEQLRGYKVVSKEGQSSSQDASLVEFEYEKEAAKRAQKLWKNNPDINLRKQVFQLYQDCHVNLEIYLEVWNIDDRVLRDKNHRARPSSEHKILTKDIYIENRMSGFGQMHYVRNLYQDYAQLSQNNNIIYFMCNNKISFFDLVSKSFVSRAIVGEDIISQQKKASHLLLHYKDLGKRNQQIESIFFFNYLEEKVMDQVQNLKQSLMLRSINFKQLNLMNSKNKDKYAPIKAKNQSINLRDDELLAYYQNNDKKRLKSFFIQRVVDSNNYIIVFPTGLLISVCVNPLSLQAKYQLNLKREESIIDFAYCVQSNFKNHCIWMMDEKLQIWKCQNELNPNSCNWILSKVNQFDNLYFKRFMTPAATYDEYYMTSSLNGLNAIQQLDLQQGPNLKFLFAYNGTTTKAAIVRQINVHEEQILSPQKHFRDEIYELIKNNITQIFAVVKNQDIIMCKIPERVSLMNRLASTMNFKVSNFVQENLQKQLKQITDQKALMGELRETKEEAQLKNKGINYMDIKDLFQKNNEIQEIIYMGLHTQKLLDGRDKKLRKFLVRKNRSLEMMYTNGLNHWNKIIPQSEAAPPFTISDVILSRNDKTLIAYYSPPDNESMVQLKTFRINKEEEFQIYNDPIMATQVNHKNMTLDPDGKLYEIVIDRINNQRSMNNPLHNIFVDKNGHKLNLRLPEVLINNDLFDKKNQLERMIQSDDGRILMCGKLLIKLNVTFDEIELIGCIVGKKKQQQNTYQFLKITDCDEKAQIESKLKNHPDHLVTFRMDLPPLYQDGGSDIIYFTHCVDEITGETSVIKMMMEDYSCFEIYQSRFRIVHFSMQQVELFTCELEGHNEKPVVSSSQLWNESNVPAEQKKIMEKLSVNMRKSFVKNISFFKEKDTGKEIKQRKTCSSYMLSLISQSQNHLNIEIIKDYNIRKNDEKQILKLNKSYSIDQDQSKSSHEDREEYEHLNDCHNNKKSDYLKQKISKIQNSIKKYQRHQRYAGLQYFINISVKAPLQTTSELGWINKKTIILTINNEYYVVNLRSKNLIQVRDQIFYSVQQVNLGIFCSLVRKVDCYKESCPDEKNDPAVVTEQNSFKYRQKQNQILIESLQSIQRMEMASLCRYCHLRNHQYQNEMEMALVFFTPAEELKGGNIFSRVASNYSIMQPYLEKIDAEFINIMNRNVQNISTYIRPEFQIINHGRLKLDFYSDDLQKKTQLVSKKIFDNVEHFEQRAGFVHMYQSDISGCNVIDYAFIKNAIFCIKAFVETLLILSDEESFANCFDKALLMMISKNMDVKDLVNSELFYVSIWKEQTVFSANQQQMIIPYAGEIEDIQFENPNLLFNSKFKMDDFVQDNKQKHKLKLEEYEMQFNYINMEDIQIESKISFSKILMKCTQIELFEQEAIQNIIDYKWQTYSFNFFLIKFILYLVFLVLYYLDLESIHYPGEDGKRMKGYKFFIRKGVCSLIQLIFFIYELLQIKNEGQEYWEDFWNYFEVAGMLLFYWAAFLDVYNDYTSDLMKILFCFSMIMSLVKIVYLVRVFQQLNFLATMLITVCNEVIYFMILFGIFLLTFAECNHILLVDINAYGRTRPLLAHFITILRCAMGDFSLIDPYQTFDIFSVEDEQDPDSGIIYRHSMLILHFTFFIWVMSIFFLFMIFMNFIIAVIGDSYNKVIELKMAYDYQQRIMMIYEREIQFSQASFEDPKKFPAILIVRKMKQNRPVKNNWQTWTTVIKNFVKIQSSKCIDTVNAKTKEQKQHFSNALKIVENDVQTLSSDIQKVQTVCNQVMYHLDPQRMSMTQKNLQPIGKMERGDEIQSELSINSRNYVQQPKVLTSQPTHLQMDIEKEKMFQFVQPQNEDLYSPPNTSKKRAQSAKRETGQRGRMNFSRPNTNPLSGRIDQGSGANDQILKRLENLETVMKQRFQHVDRCFQALSSENDDLKLTIKILVELQTQNKELMKRNVMQTENMMKENKHVQRDISIIRNNASEMLSPVRQSLTSFEQANQAQLDFLSQRGRSVMSQFNGQNSNLPMTRNQAQYPSINQPTQPPSKKEPKKKVIKKQAIKNQFSSMLDNDPFFQKYQKKFLKTQGGEYIQLSESSADMRKKPISGSKPQYEVQLFNQEQLNLAPKNEENDYLIKMNFLKSLQLDSPIDKKDINFYQQFNSQDVISIQEEAQKIKKKRKKSVYIYSEDDELKDEEDHEDEEEEEDERESEEEKN